MESAIILYAYGLVVAYSNFQFSEDIEALLIMVLQILLVIALLFVLVRVIRVYYLKIKKVVSSE
jgi:hypothetical protein